MDGWKASAAVISLADRQVKSNSSISGKGSSPTARAIAQVATRIQIAAARSVVILLYTPDDGFGDTGALTDFADGKSGPATGRG